MRTWTRTLVLPLALTLACSDDTTTAVTSAPGTSGDGNGDDNPGDGDGDPDDPGDGDGDPGDGDGDGDLGDGDGDDDPNPACALEPEPISLSLVGSEAPADACEDFVFTGRLVQGGNGNYNLDACPCGVECVVPDPYALDIGLPDPELYPIVPDCVRVQISKDEACEVDSLIIRDLDDDDALRWAAARTHYAPPSLIDVQITRVLPVECPGYEQLALEFDILDELHLVRQGETVSTSAGWTLRNYASVEPEDGPWHYAWALAR